MTKNISELLNIPVRPRRNRISRPIRDLVRETAVTPHDLVLPVFVKEGKSAREPVPSMPGIYRYGTKQLVEQAKTARKNGIRAIAVFPVIPEEKKDKYAVESSNPNGLLPRTVKELKDRVPDLAVITDAAMDPYSIDGHDGLVENGTIVNDSTLEILGQMAACQAEAGADIIAPSDMMDGRVEYIRDVLDSQGYTDTGILAYSAKYASSFYGPFREALDSAPKKKRNTPKDKKTYQMDPANSREALREILLDIDEGADMVMIKPALPYLDIISLAGQHSPVPVAAYNVSGEYAMIKAAAGNGWLDEKQAVLECLTSIKRAGADIILTYHAMDAVKILN